MSEALIVVTDDEWNTLWVAVNEIGATLEPFRNIDPIPRWVLGLDRSLDKARNQAERHLAKVP